VFATQLDAANSRKAAVVTLGRFFLFLFALSIFFS